MLWGVTAGVLVGVLTGGGLLSLTRAWSLRLRALDRTLGELEVEVEEARLAENRLNDEIVELKVERALADEARQEAEYASSKKDAYLADLSHELRTPMNGIVGMLELLLQTKLSDDQQQYARTMGGAIEGVVEVLEEILERSRGDRDPSGRQEQYVCVEQVVERVVGANAPHKDDGGSDFHCFLPDLIPGLLGGDAEQLSRRLTHLVKSAKGRCIGLRVDEVGRSTQFIDIRFAIQGASGLFDAEAAIDPEACFSMRYRLLKKGQRKPDESLRGLRVLIADGSSAGNRVLGTYIESWGADVLLTLGSSSVLGELEEAVAAGHPFDIAVLVGDNAGEQHFELAACVKANEALTSTRLVFVGPLGEGIDAQRLTRAGYDAWVSKPVGPAKLRKALRYVVCDPVGKSVDTPATKCERECGEYAAGLDVLLAEDNLVNQKVAQLLLRRCGCQVDLANNGEEAIRCVEKKHYDLILMDCRMPVLDGYEATRAIRRMSAPNATVPVIAMTANATQEDRSECLEAGMNDHLPKPVHRRALIAMLKRWGEPSEAKKQAPTKNEDAGAHTMSNESHDQTLDPDVLESLRDLGGEEEPELFAELVELFLSDTPTRIADLMKSLDGNDAKGVERAAHALKSSAANLGALNLSGLFAEIEDAGRDTDIGRAEGLAAQSNAEFERVKVALQGEIA